MYALSVTYIKHPDTPDQDIDGGLSTYVTALNNSEGAPPHDITIGRTTYDNGDVLIRLTRYSNTLAVLERLSNEFQDPTCNLYARHAWALEHNVNITYTITEVNEPLDTLLNEPVPSDITPE